MNRNIIPNLHPDAHLVKFVWEVKEDTAKELQKEQLMTSQLARGAKTINELRIEAGYEPFDIPEANMPLNLLQMHQDAQGDDLGFSVASELQDIIQNIPGKSFVKKKDDNEEDKITSDDVELSNNIDKMVQDQEGDIKTAIIQAMREWFYKIKEMLSDYLERNPTADVNEGLLDTITKITQPGNSIVEKIRQSLEESLTQVFTNVWNMNENFTKGVGVFEVVPLDAIEFVRTHALLISEKLTSDLSQRTKFSIIDGLTKGESIPKIAARIQDVLKISQNRAVTTARTETIRAMAESHYERIKQKGFERWQYFAHIDDRTCQICKPLHKRTYAIDNKSKIPPRHPNCRCTIIPVLKD